MGNQEQRQETYKWLKDKYNAGVELEPVSTKKGYHIVLELSYNIIGNIIIASLCLNITF